MIIKLTNGDFGSTLQQQTKKKKILNIQMWIQKNMVSTFRFILSSYLNMPENDWMELCLLLYDSRVICYGIIGQSFIFDMLSRK